MNFIPEYTLHEFSRGENRYILEILETMDAMEGQLISGVDIASYCPAYETAYEKAKEVWKEAFLDKKKEDMDIQGETGYCVVLSAYNANGTTRTIGAYMVEIPYLGEYARINRFGVIERGKGHGSKLFNTFFNYVKNRHQLTVVALATDKPTPQKLRDFYIKQGFKPLADGDPQPEWYEELGFDETTEEVMFRNL